MSSNDPSTASAPSKENPLTNTPRRRSGALLVVEQGFTPRDGCEERLLPGQERPGAAREQPEPVVELGGDPFG